MGLMQLLTVGRSLSEARDRPHRFKLLNGAMPNFGEADRENRKRVVRHAETAAGNAALGESRMKSEAAQAGNDSDKAMNAYPLGRWTLKANPFKSSAKPATPVVQGELSLEKVKVVRNDLTDSDLELVVAAKSASKAAVSENVFGGPPTAKRSLWARVKGCLARKKAG
jgi:hypothetical protein